MEKSARQLVSSHPKCNSQDIECINEIAKKSGSDPTVAHVLLHPESTTLNVLDICSESLAPAFLGSPDLIHRHEFKIISTGCAGIDRLLGGGLCGGDLVEFAGTSGTGKTQLAHYIALNFSLLKSLDVLYVSSGTSFVPARLVQFLNGALGKQCKANKNHILDRIYSVECFTVHSLVECITNLVNEPPSSLGLIIIDSISSLLSPLIAPGMKSGFDLMTILVDNLRILAAMLNIPILVRIFDAADQCCCFRWIVEV